MSINSRSENSLNCTKRIHDLPTSSALFYPSNPSYPSSYSSYTCFSLSSSSASSSPASYSFEWRQDVLSDHSGCSSSSFRSSSLIPPNHREHGGAGESDEHQVNRKRWDLCVLGLLVIIVGAFNNVVGKIRAKPLGRFDYFVSLFNAVAYFITYGLLLFSAFILGFIPRKSLEFVCSNRSRRNEIENEDVVSDSQRLLLSTSSSFPSPSSIQSVTSLCGGCSSCWHNCGVWKYFLLSGLLDAWGNILGFIAQPYISGPVYSLMNQAIVPFTALVSVIFLKRRYRAVQVSAILCVLTGFLIAWVPEMIKDENLSLSMLSSAHKSDSLIYNMNKKDIDNGVDAYHIQQPSLYAHWISPTILPAASDALQNRKGKSKATDKEMQYKANTSTPIPSSPNSASSSSLGFAFICALSTLPTAISFTLKEKVLELYSDQTNGEHLSILIITAFGSAFQLLWAPISLPINILLGQTGDRSLWQYVEDGITCFKGINVEGCDMCRYSITAYSVYIGINLTFNLILISFLRAGSALLTFICMKAVLPVSILLFYCFPWPLLDKSDVELSIWTILSLFVILFGVGWFEFERRRTSVLFGGTQPPCCHPFSLGMSSRVYPSPVSSTE